jgi:hypothetical protein
MDTVTVTADQFRIIEDYLTRLRDGEAYHIMEKQPQHDALVKFMGTLPGGTPPSRENDEEIIRRNLLIWSQPSCP